MAAVCVCVREFTYLPTYVAQVSGAPVDVAAECGVEFDTAASMVLDHINHDVSSIDHSLVRAPHAG